MIYQLKVTLKHVKPPIWRRLQVNADSTFYQLHHMLQIAFDWDDYHLHSFQTTAVPEDKYLESSEGDYDLFSLTPYTGKELAEIGDPEHNVGWHMFFDESEEKLSDWFKREKDKITYTYDFGDDWEHVIVLEKILSPEVDVQYPRCVKVRRRAPEEDSGGVWFENDGVETGSDHKTDADINKEIQEEVNERFHRIKDLLSVESQPNEQPDADRSSANWRELFELANQFKRLEPWQWMSDVDLFAVVDPESEETAYCCVLGEAGEAYGLAVYVGEEGFRSLIELTQNDTEVHPYRQRSLLLSFENRSDLTNDDYRVIKDLGLSYRGRHAWPIFRSLVPGFVPWYLEEWEKRFLQTVLGQAIDVCERVKDNPHLLDSESDRLFARVPKRTDKGYEWIDGSVSDSVEWENPPLYLYLSSDVLEGIRRSYPVHKRVWECDVDYFIEPVQDNRDECPYFPYLYLCVDTDSEMIVDYQLVHHEISATEIQHSFVQLIQKIKFIPSTIHIENKDTYRVLAPLAAELGIELIQAQLPRIYRAKKEMFSK